MYLFIYLFSFNLAISNITESNNEKQQLINYLEGLKNIDIVMNNIKYREGNSLSELLETFVNNKLSISSFIESEDKEIKDILKGFKSMDKLIESVVQGKISNSFCKIFNAVDTCSNPIFYTPPVSNDGSVTGGTCERKLKPDFTSKVSPTFVELKGNRGKASMYEVLKQCSERANVFGTQNQGIIQKIVVFPIHCDHLFRVTYTENVGAQNDTLSFEHYDLKYFPFLWEESVVENSYLHRRSSNDLLNVCSQLGIDWRLTRSFKIRSTKLSK